MRSVVKQVNGGRPRRMGPRAGGRSQARLVLGAQLGTVCGELRVGIVLAGGWIVNDVRVGSAVAARLPVASVGYARAQMHEGDDEGGLDFGWPGRLCV